MRVAAIIPAAGEGRRLQSRQPKALVMLLGKPLVVWTLEALRAAFSFHEMVLVIAGSQEKKFRKLLKRFHMTEVRLVHGGKTRAESVRNGLLAVSPDCEWVLVHDAARSLVSARLVKDLLRSVKKNGAVISALPVHETVKKIAHLGMEVLNTEDRRALYLAQTPQVFRKNLLERRYEALGKKVLSATDEAALFDGTRTRVKIVLGERRNVKVTTKDDLELAEFYMRLG